MKKCTGIGKRLLSSLLAAATLLPLFSASGAAFAEDENTVPPAAAVTAVLNWTPEPAQVEAGGSASVRLEASVTGDGAESAAFTVALTEEEARLLEQNFAQTEPRTLTSGAAQLTLAQGGEGWQLCFALPADGSLEQTLTVDASAPGALDVTAADVSVACLDTQGAALAAEQVTLAVSASPLTITAPRTQENTGEENTGEENTGEENTGEENTGEDPVPAGTVAVTAYAPALSLTLSGPAGMALPAPALQYALDGGQPVALTRDALAALGLTAMPQPAADTSASTEFESIAVYTVPEDTLPASYTVADGAGGAETHAVQWSLAPQSAEGFQLVEDQGVWYYLAPDGPDTLALGDTRIDIEETLPDEMEQSVFWADNNDASRRPADQTQLAQLWFSIDNGTPVQLTDATKGQVGLTDLPKITVVPAAGSSQLNVAGNQLPTKIQPMIELQDGDWQPDGEASTVTWELRPNEAISGYAVVQVTDDNLGQYPSVSFTGWYYVLQREIHINVSLHRGTTDLPQDKLVAALKNQLAFHAYWRVAGTSPDQVYPLKDMGDENLSIAPDPSNPNLYIVTVKNLWYYNLDNSRITYYVVEQDGDNELKLDNVLEAGDQLIIGYDNFSVPVTGPMLDNVVYDGGTMNLTLTGTKEYNATKTWLDAADDTARPGGTLELWRYRAGQSYTTAAPLRDGKGLLVTLKLQELPAEPGKEDSFHISFAVDFNGDGKSEDNELPKYDAEGYEYIYVVREYLDGQTADGRAANSYEQVFGAVAADGTVTDVVFDPNALELVENGQRDATNTFLYNGGTLSNRLAGTVTVPVTKQWKASAYQTSFEDVSVEVTLQSRRVGETDWQDTAIVQTLDGFRPEFMAVSDSRSAPQYDPLGFELEYRWVETAVIQAGTRIPAQGDDSARTFTLHQSGRDVEYLSTPTVSDDGDTLIVNTIANTVDYTVEKRWNDADGTGIAAPAGAAVSFTLYRAVSGDQMTGILEFILDGEADAAPASVVLSPTETVTLQETEPWVLAVKDLAEYDSEGRRYEYLLLETRGQQGFVPSFDTTIDPDTGDYETVVTNTPGQGHRILVRKDWVDDSDVEHREDVTITAFEKADPTHVVGSVTLTNGVWMDWLGIGSYEPEEVFLLETQVGDTAVPVRQYLFDAGMSPNYDDPQPPALTSEDPDHYTQIQYATANHRYEVTYSWEKFNDIDVYAVCNRRLGTIRLTVTKTWLDGADQGQTRTQLARALADADLTLSLKLDFIETDQDGVASNDYIIDYNAGTVTISPNNLNRIQDKDGVPTGAIQDLDLTRSPTEYYFWNLPKYDANGTSVRYTVQEIIRTAGSDQALTAAQLSADYPEVYKLWKNYTSSTVVSDYTISPDHTIDSQETDVTNRLTGSKDISWNLVWKDEYVYQSGQRPDVYLDVYRVVHVKNPDGSVSTQTEPYLKNYRWEYQSSAGTNVEKHWKVTLSDVPRYDELGYEIFYYAVEKTNVVASDFSYQTPRISDETADGSGVSYGTLSDPDPTVLDNEVLAEPTNEGLYPLKEGNTFINPIAGPAVAEGRKLWANWPSGVSRDDMPTVTFVLSQSHVVDGVTLVTDANYASLTVESSHWNNLPQEGGAYVFQIAYQGVNTLDADGNAQPAGQDQPLLPRFDDEGRLYIYELHEGTVQWPAAVAASGSAAADPDDVFTTTVTGDSIVNALNQSFDLRIQKYFDLPVTAQGIDPEDMEYPSITFVIERSYITNGGTSSGFEEVDTITWSAEQIKKQVEDASSSSTSSTVRLSYSKMAMLPKYAPNGSLFTYRVRELTDNLKGYDTWVVKEAVEASRVDSVLPLDANRGSQIVLAPDTNSVTFLNRYQTTNRETVTLEGTKVWSDLDDLFGLRPNSLDITLTRRAGGITAAQSGLLADEYEVTWPTDTGNTWTYRIAGKANTGELERYAPNGKPWTYVVTETKPAGYVSTPSSGAVSSSSADATGVIRLSQLKNSLLKSVPVKKQWQNSDGTSVTDNYYGSVPFTADFQLWVQADGGAWQPAKAFLETAMGTDYAAYLAAEGLPADYDFTVSLTGQINDTSAWSSSFRYNGKVFELPAALPDANGDLCVLNYKAVETRVSYGNVTQTVGPDGTVSQGGIVDSARQGTGSVINVLRDQAFQVTKIWDGDANNTYGTRPAADAVYRWAASFVVQQSLDGGRTWAPVYRYGADGSKAPLTVTLYGNNTDADNQVSKEITGLPAMLPDKTGTFRECTYRARELAPGWTAATIEDGTAVLGEDARYNETYTVTYQDGNNATAATNRAEFISFEAQKNWNPGTTATRPNVTLALQYRTAAGAWQTLKTVTLTGTPLSGSFTFGEDRAWHAVWNNVPVRLPGSDLSAGATQYQIVETVPSGFLQESSSQTGSAYTFTNVESVTLTVEKFWAGAADPDAMPAVTVALMRDGQPVTGAQVTLNAANNWSASFDPQPRHAPGGSAYVYTVAETAVDGQAVSAGASSFEYNGDTVLIRCDDRAGDSFTVRNLLTTELTGTKTWKDHSNAYGTRPTALELTLTRTLPGKDPEEVDVDPQWTGTDTDVWTYLYTDLPLTDLDGTPYTYQVTETVPANYELTQNGLALTNLLTGKTRVPVTKIWRDSGDNGGARPDQVTFTLFADGQPTGKTLTLTPKDADLLSLLGTLFAGADARWTGAFEDLDEYDSEGRRIEYTVRELEEDVPAGYEVRYQDGAIVNVRFSALTVTKTVEGTAGEEDRAFEFRLTLTDRTISGRYGDAVFEQGVALFQLKHGETFSVTDLPADLGYTVEEVNANQDGYRTAAVNAEGVLAPGTTAAVLFTNHRDAPAVPQTGDSAHPALWAGLAALSLLALAACVRRRRSA